MVALKLLAQVSSQHINLLEFLLFVQIKDAEQFRHKTDDSFCIIKSQNTMLHSWCRYETDVQSKQSASFRIDFTSYWFLDWLHLGFSLISFRNLFQIVWCNTLRTLLCLLSGIISVGGIVWYFSQCNCALSFACVTIFPDLVELNFF